MQQIQMARSLLWGLRRRRNHQSRAERKVAKLTRLLITTRMMLTLRMVTILAHLRSVFSRRVN